LHKGGFLGEEEYLDARTDLEVAELNLRNAEARLEEHLEDLSKTVIRAPHDGMVTRLDVVEGEVISGVSSTSQGTEVLTVAELDELYMEADINEVDVELFETGDVARLSFDALQELEVEGSIDTISSSARKDGEVRVFPIEIVFDAPDAGIRPGISATAEIPVAAEDDVVSVLLSTVFKGEDGSYVYLKRADGWDRRSVETGINNLQHVAILSGLEVGDEVALRRPKNHRNE
ncbi:MAG: efflux RND transporter periplasmic adaptor subunit, partial [Opitutales bacterium]